MALIKELFIALVLIISPLNEQYVYYNKSIVFDNKYQCVSFLSGAMEYLSFQSVEVGTKFYPMCLSIEDTQYL